jgi:hypothetical protein
MMYSHPNMLVEMSEPFLRFPDAHNLDAPDPTAAGGIDLFAAPPPIFEPSPTTSYPKP